MPSWDAQVYAAFADERSRPFADLLARVGAAPRGRWWTSAADPGRSRRASPTAGPPRT